MIDLSGNKLANKRYDARKFNEKYSNRISIEFIDESNLEEVKNFQKKWWHTLMVIL